MVNRALQVPKDQFAAVWNESETLDDAAAKVRELVKGAVPRWAVMARANSLRKEGIEMKPLSVAKTAA
jgi:hypothetical protein